MPKLPFYRLRVIIPALVCLATFLIVGYQTYHRLRDSRDFFYSNTRQMLGFKMNELQGLLSDLMLRGDPEQAQQAVAKAALDRRILALLLTDQNDRVLLADRPQWRNAQAQTVTRFDPAKAKSVRSAQSPLISSREGQLVAYYPVLLGPRPGEPGPRQFGTLLLRYDYSRLLSAAREQAFSDAARQLVVAVILSLLLLVGLHFLVTKPIEGLLAAMEEVSRGNLEVRCRSHGHGDIDLLAEAFDQMAAKLAAKQNDLLEQAAELEREVAERQAAQEGLEQQTVLLEEEIAERQKIEQSLQEAISFNRQIIDGAQEGIVVYDRGLRYRVWNRFMERLSGLPAEEVIGRQPLELFPFLENTGVRENLEMVLAGEQVEEKEYPFAVIKSGRSGWVSHASSPLRDTNGEITGVIAIIRDLTVHKKTEEQLRQSQKMEAVGQLAGGIAHDFNNILTVIVSCGEMLRADPTLSRKQGDHTGQILAAAERAAQLTRGLLAFSRKQVMTPRVEDLNVIVQRVRTLLARIVGEDLQLAVTCHPAPLWAKVDAGQVEQVLIHLVTNARDAMPGGGLLAIATEPERVEENDEGLPCGNYAVIAVSDTGHGMDEETRERIFEPFFTTKETGKGTGLGMSIVHGIVRQHGGFIRLQSEPGAGSRFSIYLPLWDEEPATSDAPPALLPPRGGTETLLIAEDDAEIRGMFAALLSEYGYLVIAAEDGADAIEKFMANRDRIGLSILDVVMPKKNGVEVSDEIRRLRPEMKTLYCTGYGKDLLEKRGRLTGSEDVMMKPVRPMDLLRKVREMLDRG